VARVAVAKWESDTIPFYQKVQMAIDSIAGLASSVPQEYALKFKAEQNAILAKERDGRTWLSLSTPTQEGWA
jgi:hypothetical protein